MLRNSARRALRWLALLFGLAAVIAAGAWLSTRNRAVPIHYQTAVVDRGPVAAKVTANGALSALITVSVGSQVSGRINSLRADFGSRVKQGEVIATIEPSMFVAAVRQARANRAAARASLERARAQRVNAERQYARQKSLLAQRLVAEADYDAAEAALGVSRADVQAAAASATQAQAALDQAELNLRYTTIVSPIDGVVISRNVDVGQTVAAALQAPTLFTIAHDLTRMQVDTNIAEADVGKVHAGMPVIVHRRRLPGPRIRRHGEAGARQRADAAERRDLRRGDRRRQLRAPAEAGDDGDRDVRATRSARTCCACRTPRCASGPTAPRSRCSSARRRASPSAADERVLWLLRAGRAEPVRVHVGISDGVFTEVLAGDVHAGERAVVEANGDAKPAA